MSEHKNIRKPMQKRALEKKNKILVTSRKLFSDKNYFNVSTNEIAKEAGISIGTLYSYYKSKEDILIDLVEAYHQTFLSVFSEINQPESLALFKSDPKVWLKNLVSKLLTIEDAAFHQEIEILAVSVPEVKRVVLDQQEKMKNLTYEHFLFYANKTNPHQIKILAVILFDFISSLVDELLYVSHSNEESEEILEMGINAIHSLIGEYLN